jgi:E3 ubiquitin-protein ligase makorin
VIPNIDFPKTYEEKARVIEDYKSTLRSTPCRNFNYGEGDCAFGSSCFYEHRYRNGEIWNPPPPRFIMDEEGVWTVERPAKLADILENLL